LDTSDPRSHGFRGQMRAFEYANEFMQYVGNRIAIAKLAKYSSIMQTLKTRDTFQSTEQIQYLFIPESKLLHA